MRYLFPQPLLRSFTRLLFTFLFAYAACHKLAQFRQFKQTLVQVLI
jgi:hypothetical protein